MLEIRPVNIQAKIKEARLRLVQMHFESKVGHIGGNLSCLDALLVLFHQFKGPKDQIILSKGHGAGALYVALWSVGILSNEDLKTFHGEGTKIAGHPAPCWLPEIPFATGSLGHGLSLASGVALGKKLCHQPGHVYCVTSDGEWQEGSTWEALIFAAHHRLDNLTVLIDANGLQGFGSTKEVASMDQLAQRIRAFDVDVVEIDGHDSDLLTQELSRAQLFEKKGPRFIFMKTMKGRGISFMENKMEWHYLPMNENEYRLAQQELESR